LSEAPVKKILKDFGLTEKEAEMYVFLTKYGALRSGEISRLAKIDKGEVYRILKSLGTKGLIEKTMEAPARFMSTPFERAIDSFIKNKREEVSIVERKRNELI
jgi:sugar-specific transcriptional regulator TrmB